MLCLVLLIGLLVAVAAQPAPEKVITNSIDMKLTLIPAGKFVMGSPAGESERDAEEVQHEVTITKPFYMGVHEVTQAQFQKLMGKNNSHHKGPDLPAEQVRFPEAEIFCKRLSELEAERKAGRVYRLPTEAEWEYACRGGTTTTFHVGNTLSAEQANFNGNYPFGDAAKGANLQKTAKVGSYPPNAWGLYDMHGNVSEWCSDFYDPDYYKTSPKADPKGPAKGVMATGFANNFFMVVRGGNWLDEGRALRSAYRYRFQSSEPYRLVGFRVVCVVKS